MQRARAAAIILLAASWVTVGEGAASVRADVVRGLAGRWAGMGTVVHASGPSQTFKCVITYFPSDDGSAVKQNLRCKSSSHSFDAATHLRIDGGVITGHWQDNIHPINGTVDGAITPDGFDIQLSGKFVNARMTVLSLPCEQSVTIVPDRAVYMKELAAVLRKC
jgi:hypothetical protein